MIYAPVKFIFYIVSPYPVSGSFPTWRVSKNIFPIQLWLWLSSFWHRSRLIPNRKPQAFNTCSRIKIQLYIPCSVNLSAWPFAWPALESRLFGKKNKRETGFEPATFALARRRSTPEPLAHFAVPDRSWLSPVNKMNDTTMPWICQWFYCFIFSYFFGN